MCHLCISSRYPRKMWISLVLCRVADLSVGAWMKQPPYAVLCPAVSVLIYVCFMYSCISHIVSVCLSQLRDITILITLYY